MTVLYYEGNRIERGMPFEEQALTGFVVELTKSALYSNEASYTSLMLNCNPSNISIN